MAEIGRDKIVVGVSGGKGIDQASARLIGKALGSMEAVELFTGAGDGGPQIVAEVYYQESTRGTFGVSPSGNLENHRAMGFPEIEGMELEFTGAGIGRNGLFVEKIDALVVLPGELGTLSEVVMAVEMGRQILVFGSELAEKIRQTIKAWKPSKDTSGIVGEFDTPDELQCLIEKVPNAPRFKWE